MVEIAWGEYPGFPERTGPPEPCRALWCAVIRQALQEALGQDAADTNKYPPARLAGRRAAQGWFRPGNADFRAVCLLAGVDPDWVAEKARVLFAKAEEMGYGRRRLTGNFFGSSTAGRG